MVEKSVKLSNTGKDSRFAGNYDPTNSQMNQQYWQSNTSQSSGQVQNFSQIKEEKMKDSFSRGNPTLKKTEIPQSNESQGNPPSHNSPSLNRSKTYISCYEALSAFKELEAKQKRKVGNDFISLMDDNMNEASKLYFEFIELFDSDPKLESSKEEFEQSFKGDLNKIKAQKLLPLKIEELKSGLINKGTLSDSVQKEKAQLFDEICKIDSKTAFDFFASFQEVFEKNQRLKVVKDQYWNEMKKHIKQFELGSDCKIIDTIKNISVYKKESASLTDPEKSEVRNILVVGETGSGKSTLLNSMTTYLLGINYFDSVRVKTIVENSRISQSQTQTLQVTEYIVKPDPTRFCYPIRFIDTPGFGDTRGLEYDDDNARKIWKYFKEKRTQIHGICLVMKATTNRITSIHQYILQQIFKLFGKDIKENFIGMITFADNQTTLAVKAIKDAQIPVNDIFRFNNSAFFPSKTTDDDLKLTQLYWEMSMQNFKDFFNFLLKIKPITLELPKQVIKDKEKLETKVKKHQEKILEGIKTIRTIEKKTAYITENLEKVSQTKQYTYEEDYTESIIHNHLPCQFTIYCINCQYMACQQIGYNNFEGQFKNSAMKDGNCTECPGKCSWTSHEKLGYYYEKVTQKRSITKNFNEVPGFNSVNDVLNYLITKKEEVTKEIINNIKQCQKYLMLLNPESLQSFMVDVADYLNMMIQVEDHERREGFKDRISQIESIKDHLLGSLSNDYKTEKSVLPKASSSQDKYRGSNHYNSK